jgi:chemotaxis protein MotB
MLFQQDDVFQMARPKKQHAHENHERWLLTYADMITLLVAFFIMLYAMSVMNQHKFEQVAISVKSGFGGDLMGRAPSILNGAGMSSQAMSVTEEGSQTVNKEVQEIAPHFKQKDLLVPAENGSDMDGTLAKLRSVIAKDHLQKTVMVKSEERGIVVTVLTDKFLFNRGDADIRQQNSYVLDVMSVPLRSIPNQIRVEGYTDDLPICTERFPSNWELSTTRATVVLRYFIDHHELSPDRLSAAGYADTRPICPNTDEQHRAMNRRVEIVVLKNDEMADN